jgi:hypothetical protein
MLPCPPNWSSEIKGSDVAYEAILRRGLEYSLREKGPDHEETQAHRIALVALLRRMGREADAHAVEMEQ